MYKVIYESKGTTVPSTINCYSSDIDWIRNILSWLREQEYKLIGIETRKENTNWETISENELFPNIRTSTS